jgi:hypothetical protein
MGRMQRTKGATFERLIANRLKEFFPSARRGIGQARSAKEVCDVEGTPYWMELKHHVRVNIQAAWRQAIAQRDDREPVVISKNNNEEPLATISLELFLKLITGRGSSVVIQPLSSADPIK